ncbi:MAG: glutamate--cysteine ligase [Bdellovibrionaceae bacterium]|nr:glutamate--cysteine ligase [Bdellovibrionales bacterium]MCB9085282.1 glutamate--cysteine ligase [Pseudobdellovibrionaceae bacterium]
MVIHELIHKKIVENRTAVDQWFETRGEGLAFPFYSSFDIRDSGEIVAPVDANIFPAGFNNICQVDKEGSVVLAKCFLDCHYGEDSKRIVLLTEEHTANLYYWDNVAALYDLLSGSGREVQIALPKNLDAPLQLTSASGRELTVHGAHLVDGEVTIEGKKADLIVCNNDFSEAYEEWASALRTPMNPPHTLGWHRRRKSEFFDWYNKLAGEFAEVIKIPSHILQVETEIFKGFDVADEESRNQLAVKVEEFMSRLERKYAANGVKHKPFVFVKNNAGTYGLAVIQARSGDEIRNWNYKSRKKMKASKGGRGVGEVIIQEGIPTSMTTEAETAEPAIYLIGCQLAGGFLRAHSKKGPDDSLNSPGAVFKRLCVSDLNISIEGAPLENVYGWLAKLGVLAIAHEARDAGVEFRAYENCCPFPG